MPKKFISKLDVVVEMKDGSDVRYELPSNEAREKFNYLVRCACEIGFERVRSIRLVGAREHVLFEWRDIRSFDRQSNLLDYECAK